MPPKKSITSVPLTLMPPISGPSRIAPTRLCRMVELKEPGCRPGFFAPAMLGISSQFGSRVFQNVFETIVPKSFIGNFELASTFVCACSWICAWTKGKSSLTDRVFNSSFTASSSSRKRWISARIERISSSRLCADSGCTKSSRNSKRSGTMFVLSLQSF